MTESLLVIDDEPARAAQWRNRLEGEGWKVHTVATLSAAAAVLATPEPPLLVLARAHLRAGGVWELLTATRGDTLDWILLGVTPEEGARARTHGVYALPDPAPDAAVSQLVAAGAHCVHARRRLSEACTRASGRFRPERFVGVSAAARAVRDLAGRIGRERPAAVLIGGEAGTGKRLAAHVLHYASERSSDPLVRVRAAGRDPLELEQELFGPRPASTRGPLERAAGGTLLVAGIGALGPALQERLLDELDRRGAAAPRLIATDSGPSDQPSVAGSPAPRLARIAGRARLYLPPLRERREDLAALVPHLVSMICAAIGTRSAEVPEAVWRELRAYDWPGNVRELRNALERAILLGDDGRLASPRLGGADHPARLYIPLDGSLSLNDMDRRIIQAALERSRYNVTAAARALGTTRETLRYRIHKHGLHRNRGEKADADRNPSADCGS